MKKVLGGKGSILVLGPRAQALTGPRGEEATPKTLPLPPGHRVTCLPAPPYWSGQAERDSFRKPNPIGVVHDVNATSSQQALIKCPLRTQPMLSTASWLSNS